MFGKILGFNPRIFSLFGVAVTMHISLPILLLVLLVNNPTTAYYALLGFLSVIPHEFGHILAARYYGVQCKKVMMTAVGGMAMLESMPKEWQKELWITAWGPIVSLILCLWSAALFVVTFGITDVFMILAIINGVLFLFNILVVFPMDGGRMFRAALASHMPYLDATRIAVRVGQGVAVVIALFGALGGSFLLPIMMFMIGIMGEGELENAKAAQRQEDKKNENLE